MTTHDMPLGAFDYNYLGETEEKTYRSVTNAGTTVSTSWKYDTNVHDRRLIAIENSGITRSYALSYQDGKILNRLVEIDHVGRTQKTSPSMTTWMTESRTYIPLSLPSRT
jgi:hypothetical protein